MPRFALTLACALALAGPAAAQKLQVVTTFTIIADMAQNVAGDAADVASLIPAGAEVHNFQPTPSDIRSASDIDLVWQYDIMPLLEEHYYGQLHRNTIRERFGIDSIRKAVAGRNLSGEPSGATGIPVAPEMLGDAAGHEDE